MYLAHDSSIYNNTGIEYSGEFDHMYTVSIIADNAEAEEPYGLTRVYNVQRQCC